MPNAAVVMRSERDVVRLCHSGLDVAGARQQLLRALRRVVPFDAAFVATADPETLLFTGGWSDAPLDTVAAQFMENEFGQPDVNKFAALATGSRHVGSLDLATRSDRAASERYRQIMNPLGLGDELRAALVADGYCWGYLCLHRESRAPGFSSADGGALARLAPHIAQAFRKAVLLHPSMSSATVRSGVVILADDLSVVSMTSEAEHLLSLLADDAGLLPLPTPVHAVARALDGITTGTGFLDRLPYVRVPTASGVWLNVYASRLGGTSGGAGQTAVVIEPVSARAAVPLMLAAYGLSQREGDVARLVLRGQATAAIADALHISQHTVQDHLKSVFDKTGVRSRRDLVGRLLSPPPN